MERGRGIETGRVIRRRHISGERQVEREKEERERERGG